MVHDIFLLNMRKGLSFMYRQHSPFGGWRVEMVADCFPGCFGKSTVSIYSSEYCSKCLYTSLRIAVEHLRLISNGVSPPKHLVWS